MLSEHTKAKQALEAEIKEAIALGESQKAQADSEKATLEAQYREKLVAMETEHQAVINNHAKSNDDATERMQKEIDTVQLSWQQAQQQLISKLQNEHEVAVQTLQSQHQAAIELLESKLTAAIDESTALKLKSEVFYRKL